MAWETISVGEKQQIWLAFLLICVFLKNKICGKSLRHCFGLFLSERALLGSEGFSARWTAAFEIERRASSINALLCLPPYKYVNLSFFLSVVLISNMAANWLPKYHIFRRDRPPRGRGKESWSVRFKRLLPVWRKGFAQHAWTRRTAV